MCCWNAAVESKLAFDPQSLRVTVDRFRVLSADERLAVLEHFRRPVYKYKQPSKDCLGCARLKARCSVEHRKRACRSEACVIPLDVAWPADRSGVLDSVTGMSEKGLLHPEPKTLNL